MQELRIKGLAGQITEQRRGLAVEVPPPPKRIRRLDCPLLPLLKLTTSQKLEEAVKKSKLNERDIPGHIRNTVPT